MRIDSVNFNALWREYPNPAFGVIDWRLDQDGGMSGGIPVSQLPVRTLTAQVQRLLTPRNMFVAPPTYSGLGEVPDFISALQAAASEAR